MVVRLSLSPGLRSGISCLFLLTSLTCANFSHHLSNLSAALSSECHSVPATLSLPSAFAYFSETSNPTVVNHHGPAWQQSHATSLPPLLSVCLPSVLTRLISTSLGQQLQLPIFLKAATAGRFHPSHPSFLLLSRHLPHFIQYLVLFLSHSVASGRQVSASLRASLRVIQASSTSSVGAAPNSS